MIGFYYGRRPSRFQQDTVLQHSRMFGYRTKEDLAVTRFYTALAIYSVMERINEFDNALREAFEKKAHSGVVFIRKDTTNRILPCSPNKLSISKTTTLTPSKRLLPVGFQTGYKTNIKSKLEEIDSIIENYKPDNRRYVPFPMDLSEAFSIIDIISSMLIFEQGWEWDVNAFKACLEFLSRNTDNKRLQGKIWCVVRTGLNIARERSNGVFSNAPDTGTGETAFSEAREIAVNIPALILIRENGKAEQGWRDSPFWWPVMVTPQNTRPVIYANEFIDIDET